MRNHGGGYWYAFCPAHPSVNVVMNVMMMVSLGAMVDFIKLLNSSCSSSSSDDSASKRHLMEAYLTASQLTDVGRQRMQQAEHILLDPKEAA